MDSLANYGSDDDYDSSEEQNNDHKSATEKNKSERKPDMDANYDEVGMDLSEDSDEQKPSGRRRSPSPKKSDGGRHKRSERNEREREDRGDRSRRERDYRSRERNGRHRDSYRRRSRDRRRSRTRSRSRDRNSRRRPTNRSGLPTKRPEPNLKTTDHQDDQKDRFFMPGITGRFREQIERRKMLWQKKSEPDSAKCSEPVPGLVQPLGGSGGSRATKVWETTTFAQDTDGKVASKFKRLMGIRNTTESANVPGEVQKKQEEMFSSMEQQYEVARTATHTMRGVGLGFGSYQK